MSDLKTSIIMDLTGNLERQAARFASGLGRLASRGSASMRFLSAATHEVGRGIDALGNRYTALIGGAAGVGAAKMVANLEERFVRLGIDANRSADEINALKKQIFETATAPEIRVDPGQITAAVEEITKKTGDLEFARDNIRNIGLAIQATGGEGISIGGIMAEFQKMGMGAKQAFEAIDILTVQGKEGAFTLADLASLGPRVVTAYTAMGRTGVPAIRELGAALQVIRQGTGSSEQAATAFEALLRTLGDADKLKLLQKGGIQVFQPGSTTVMRSLPDIMEAVIKKTEGSKVALSKVFDAEAIRAFNAAAGEFQRTGKVESLRRFVNVQADGSTITLDSARAAQTANAALQNLYTVWQKFADSELTKPIQSLANSLNSLEPGTVERWMKIGTGIGAAVAGVVALKKTVEYGKYFRDLMKPGGKGGAAGGLGGKFGDAIPVYVVNGPSSIWPGAGEAPGGSAAKNASKYAPWALGASPLLPAAGATIVAAASIAAGKQIAESQASWASTSALQEMRSRHMVMGGGQNSFQVRTIDAELAKRMEQGMNGTITLQIDAAGQARLKTLKSDPSLTLNVDTGPTMVGG